MTEELKSIFNQFADLIDRWNKEDIANEGDLLAETKVLNAKLKEELMKPEPKQQTIDGSE